MKTIIDIIGNLAAYSLEIKLDAENYSTYRLCLKMMFLCLHIYFLLSNLGSQQSWSICHRMEDMVHPGTSRQLTLPAQRRRQPFILTVTPTVNLKSAVNLMLVFARPVRICRLSSEAPEKAEPSCCKCHDSCFWFSSLFDTYCFIMVWILRSAIVSRLYLLCFISLCLSFSIPCQFATIFEISSLHPVPLFLSS